MASAMKNMAVCQSKMEEYIGETTIGQLVEELESHSKDVQKRACECLFLLIEYYGRHEKKDIRFAV